MLLLPFYTGSFCLSCFLKNPKMNTVSRKSHWHTNTYLYVISVNLAFEEPNPIGLCGCLGPGRPGRAQDTHVHSVVVYKRLPLVTQWEAIMEVPAGMAAMATGVAAVSQILLEVAGFSCTDSCFLLISWWRCWERPGNLQQSKTNYLTSCCGICSLGWTVTKFCHLSSLSIGGYRFERWPMESFFFIVVVQVFIAPNRNQMAVHEKTRLKSRSCSSEI